MPAANNPPIAVLSFNRPQLLRRVLISLRDQTLSPDPADVTLFQDGGSGNVDECSAIFKEIFPQGRLLIAERNLGIALNFDRAERYAFESLKADYGIFLEDDLVLGPHYLTALRQLTEFALSEPRVAYVAAYGDHRASLAQQKARSAEVIPMDHKWGFAMTRRQWERQREIIEPYLDLIRDKPYYKRDNRAIYSYFDKLGYSAPGTSQDGAKDVASHVLGTTKVMSFACFGVYEGREGVHFTSKMFDASKYEDTILYPEEPKLVMPTSLKLDEWISTGRAVAKTFTGPWATLSLCNKIFGSSPYIGFKPIISEPDLQGWNGNHPALIRMVSQLRPKIIVDVGVWKGQSTITLAKAQREVAYNGTLVAVDTFLGSPEHWNPERKDVQESLRFQNGMPSFYQTFLSNVVLSGMSNYIVPIAQTSENAAEILKRHKVAPDLVHIDAAHEYEPVLQDIKTWWGLLKPGGMLMGDDFVWPGVARAVVHFSDSVGIPFNVEHPKWWIQKPSAIIASG